jgi:hypothetical protein
MRISCEETPDHEEGVVSGSDASTRMPSVRRG